MNIIKNSAKWMWEHKGQNLFFTPSVLTNSNPDPTSPNLNMVEALSVFKTLEEYKLIYPHSQNKLTVYSMNETKEDEWSSFIKNYSSFCKYLIQPIKYVFRKGFVFVFWIVSLIISGTIGALIKEFIHKYLN